ncbi:RNA-directed DNA polymerase from mobile element jockey [Elysia marginata]|uniref:RNA-directed DNA polymerase from mobile element jockey n=1 Tax=Elysia marginata TaxID=1093978 RepID=A0AAV4GVG6_9GAST|nr:RNA-directed DNA polymerase from mobile element jockey [Elysia marginata]
MLTPNIAKSLTGFWPVSKRIIVTTLSSKPFDTNIIQMYAPTTDHDDTEVEAFYEKLDKTLQQLKSTIIKIIMGDFNAKEDILQTGVWPKPWTQSLVITLPKTGNLKLCQNYRTISLISHPSKVMLKVFLNRLKPQAEKTIAEDQAGFRPGRSTVERICNIRILMEKYLQHQQELHHVFIDFKKAFDESGMRTSGQP